MDQLWNQAGPRLMLEGALREFYTFTLVLVRMSGLMAIGPLFGQSMVPTTFRVLLVFSISLVVTPSLRQLEGRGFTLLDRNENLQLERAELPDGLTPRFDRIYRQTGDGTAAEETSSLSRSDWLYSIRPVPGSVFEYVRIAAAELVLGLVLGLGVMILLTGLQTAGELIDQQSGISLGEIAAPGLDISGSISGTFLFLMGTAILVLLKPFGGHLLMMRALLETWQTLPPGEAVMGDSTISLLSSLVQSSLILGIRVAAPLLATMALMALAMGFLGHTVQQFDLFSIGFPIRSLVAMLVLSIVVSGVGGVLTESIPETIDQLRDSIVLPHSDERSLLADPEL
ncbi:MAG: flagellar biosynthetic protein FliR [Planctomycetaceae bacterium]|nr:flagellar biosynthetic protein FliR [Planctomycetaceae bacterium]